MSVSMGERLRNLKLCGMATAWERQEAGLDVRGTATRLAELLDAQEALRRDGAREKGRRLADVPMSSARLRDVRFEPGRGLSRPWVEAVQSWEWVRAHRNLLLAGATGRGKTWIASAIANDALSDGLCVRWFDVQSFLQQWYMWENENALARFLKELSRTNLIVLDRWAAHPIDAHGVARLEALVLAREEKTSFLVCSTEPVSAWVGWLGGGAVAEGVVDRLVSRRANTLELKGPSLRGAPNASVQRDRTQKQRAADAT